MMKKLMLPLLVAMAFQWAGFAQRKSSPSKIREAVKEIRETGEIGIDGKTYRIESQEKISEDPGARYYFADNREYYAGIFAVYIPGAYAKNAPLPLVVSSHGYGGNGILEAQSWAGEAEKYGFIAVCPSFALASDFNMGSLADDDKMLCEIMERVLADLKVDRDKVLGSGFSGGGLPAFHLMMNHPEWFTSLCFRSANLRKGLSSRSQWKNRPIYIFWGEKDHHWITQRDGPPSLMALLKMKGLSAEYKKRPDENLFESADATFRWELIKNGGHDSRTDLAAKWFAEKVIKKP